MSLDANKAPVWRFHKEVVATGDFSCHADLVAPGDLDNNEPDAGRRPDVVRRMP